MTVELKACPFCGGKAQIMHTKNVDATKWFVTCLVCGVETPRIARNAAEAYRAWNRRTDEQKHDAGNRKQSEGEWETIPDYSNALITYRHICRVCGCFYKDIRPYGHKYCHECGAKMKGGE